MEKKLEMLVKIKPIVTPNFIILENGSVLPVSDFSEEELRKLGERFTMDLIEKKKYPRS